MPGQTVLIIDDDAQFRADLTAILGGAGYKALEAHDGRSALAALWTNLGQASTSWLWICACLRT